MPNLEAWVPPVVGVMSVIFIVFSRVQRVNKRMARLFDPIVRWWTRGTLVDDVYEREIGILQKRTQDIDILESYLIYVSHWMVDAQLKAAEKGILLDPPISFSEFKGKWLRQHPDYINYKAGEN